MRIVLKPVPVVLSPRLFIGEPLISDLKLLKVFPLFFIVSEPERAHGTLVVTG